MNYLLPFESATFTRSYLFNHYERQQTSNASSKSYRNCYPFIYHLQHGKLYLEQTLRSPIELQPILLFYGLSQMLKGCLLIVDPLYPETSSVLAHGVSTRKRKKQGYSFLQDEVKVQRNGLYAHMLTNMFHVKHQEREKYSMLFLLKQLPDLGNMFTLLRKEEVFLQGRIQRDHFLFSTCILDSYHMTSNRFEQYIHEHGGSWLDTDRPIIEGENSIRLPLKNGKIPPTEPSPLLYDQTGLPHLHVLKKDAGFLPELAVHYLLLYNLSMICRYEAEWWGELLHTFDSHDLPLIKSYLALAHTRLHQLFEAFLSNPK
ncbi:YaaC family protein [Shouchella shacheensis]|uniref:YaaC family protein n=1 Tax=Shouchella shacheensis TaxID=1649580 RepID=UPI000AD6FF77|nr:YaaC family protein [Shouchella shacheensis]